MKRALVIFSASVLLAVLTILLVTTRMDVGADYGVISLLEMAASAKGCQSLAVLSQGNSCSSATTLSATSGLHEIGQKSTEPCLSECEEAIPPKHVVVAENLVQHLMVTKNNAYFNGCGQLQKIGWDNNCAEAFVDSSAFITLILYHVDNWKVPQLTSTFGTVNPTAAEYYDAALQHRGLFVTLDCITDLQKGDFLFIKYLVPNQNVSGHCMIVDDSPVLVKKSKFGIPNGFVAYDVAVIDAAMTAHGSSDTRVTHPGKWGSNGVGRGIFRLYSDKNEKILGHSWSTETPKIHRVTNQPIVMARIDDTYSNISF